MELNAWSDDLTVEVGGHGVVSHAGSAVLRLLAGRTGLTAALSKALARRGFTPVHDRGRVLSDLATLRDQPELYGSVASDPTAVAGAGGDRPRPTGPDRHRPSEDPPPGVGTDRGPPRRDPALAGSRRGSGEDDRDPDGRHDPDRTLGQTGRSGHVQGHLRPSPAHGVVRQHRRAPALHEVPGVSRPG